jgi:hypothetical protein
MEKKAKMLSELEELKMAEKDSSTPAEALDGIREAITNLQTKIDGYKERKPKAKSEPKEATKTATVKKPRGAGKPNPDFAKVQQIAKNLKAKDPSLKHTKAVSMAWAEVRGGAPAKTTKTPEKAPEKKAEPKKLDKLKVTAKPKETAKKAVVKKASEAPKKKNDLIEKVKRAKAKVKRVGKTYSYKQNGEVRTFQRDKKKDGLRTAKHVGKRVSKEGNVYYEYRDNRADVNIGKVSYKRPSLYAKGGLAKIKIPTFSKSNEMSVLLAVYRSRIDGLNGSLEYFKSGASRYFHEQVRGNVSEEISRIKEKISEVENDIKFLQEEKYPIDIELGKYEATKFLNDLNNLVRTNSGRRLFNTDVEKLNEEYYSAYERVYDVLDSYVDSKYEITYAKGGILDAYDQKAFKEWLDDGNVSKNPDGTYSTQDAQYQNRIESLTELKKYFKKEILEFAKGGKVDAIKMGDNVHVVAENKSGVVTNVIANGKSFSVSFANGTKNVYDKNELKKVYSDEDYDDYAKGGEMDERDSMSYARTKGKESIDWDKELREYVGSNYSKLSEREKKEIISDMQKDFDRRYSFADGGEMDDENQRFDVNPNVTSTLANLQPYLDEYTMRKLGSKFPP